MKKIIIFGTGEFGSNIYKKYKKDHDIIYFCDNDKKKHNTSLYGIKILSPEKIHNIEYDEIIIASSFSEEIYPQLINELGIDKNKIIKLYVNESKTQFYSQEKKEKSEYFMFEIAHLLNKNRITYYLDHGTLLGIVRDNCIIPWDKDIDFAVLIEDKDKIITLMDNYLISYNHPGCKINNWNYRIAEQTLTVENQTKTLLVEMQIFNTSDFEEEEVALDLMFRYTEESMLCWAVCGKYLTAPRTLCFPTKNIIYKGNRLNIPNNVEKYLTNLYGDWKVPVKEWTYEKFNNITNKE
ncbi:LicD family protein [Legionella sp. km772]|uniref:LicD family protein n=1 Tax=Legionella sp. km772 TaxID=2498111 RepID=UPI000F8DF6FB|nr:LicD family protein [Legionella sp. km772]RUR10164.1 hypothetical protein ELY15_08460 [Legionella sp. km772]